MKEKGRLIVVMSDLNVQKIREEAKTIGKTLSEHVHDTFRLTRTKKRGFQKGSKRKPNAQIGNIATCLRRLLTQVQLGINKNFSEQQIREMFYSISRSKTPEDFEKSCQEAEPKVIPFGYLASKDINRTIALTDLKRAVNNVRVSWCRQAKIKLK